MKSHESNILVMLRSTLQRLPLYYCYVSEKSKAGEKYISAVTMATFFDLNPVLVRKDIEAISSIKGCSRLGFDCKTLEQDLRTALGYDTSDNAILVGVGSLGHALLSYEGFKDFGLNIVTGFDNNENLHGVKVGGKPVLPLDNLESFVQRNNIRLAIITVPKEEAQDICNLLVKCGIRGIWNFAPVSLEVQKGIYIKNENLSASFASLSIKLAQQLKAEAEQQQQAK